MTAPGTSRYPRLAALWAAVVDGLEKDWAVIRLSQVAYVEQQTEQERADDLSGCM